MDGVRSYFDGGRPELVPLLPRTYGKVLEIGCGAGGFARHLHAATEMWAVEPNSAVAASAAKQGYKVMVGTYDEVSNRLPEAYFDLVIANDVIEHMPDHDSFLKSVTSVMQPGGRLMGSVPNMRYYPVLLGLVVRGRWDYTDMGVLDRTHLRWFTIRSLRKTLEQHGFSVEHLDGINRDRMQWGHASTAVHAVVRFAMMCFTLGASGDMAFPQIAFRARVRRE